MRKLKFHEKKLLKKVNFLEWKREKGHREASVMQRYHVTGRDDYKKYNGICSMVKRLADMLMKMDPKDPFRTQMTESLLEKFGDRCPFVKKCEIDIVRPSLNAFEWMHTYAVAHSVYFFYSLGYVKYNMGVIPTKKSLAMCERLTASTFCRRRLSTVLVRLKFAEHLTEAVTHIEQGHIRVGPETVTDPAFHVTRSMEDFVTWVDTSKIRRKVLEYNERLDDYDAMNL